MLAASLTSWNHVKLCCWPLIKHSSATGRSWEVTASTLQLITFKNPVLGCVTKHFDLWLCKNCPISFSNAYQWNHWTDGWIRLKTWISLNFLGSTCVSSPFCLPLSRTPGLNGAVLCYEPIPWAGAVLRHKSRLFKWDVALILLLEKAFISQKDWSIRWQFWEILFGVVKPDDLGWFRGIKIRLWNQSSGDLAACVIFVVAWRNLQPGVTGTRLCCHLKNAFKNVPVLNKWEPQRFVP